MARRRPSTVLVTGASSGIGRALAIEYARRGAKVMATARREAELGALCAQIAATGGEARFAICDVADPDAAAEAVKKADRDLGSLDLVVANAGVGGTRHASRLTVADVTRMIDVNVRGAMATLVAAIPIMLAHGQGQIVGVSSLAGRQALPRVAAYNASKAALSSFLETLRLDLAETKIGVTDVQPGFVDSEMTAKNKHPMPFMWSAPRAARVIADRLEKNPRVIAFPLPLDLATRASSLIPYPLYGWLTRRMTASAG
jgi:NADP-dependent 3-hydroxy acid dehydrogenase YdfG